MPWRETSVMEERLRFVVRLLEGEGMNDVCPEFGISRKTGYRFKDDGLEALTDRSRRPVRNANQLPEPVEAMIVSCKKNKPHWGARETGNYWSGSLPATCGYRRRARCMPFSIATGWSLVPAGDSAVGRRERLISGNAAEGSVVRPLQGRVQARQRPILLPADGD
ncbi:hypothetical protein ABIA27_001230 [Sinorhizobium fredii]